MFTTLLNNIILATNQLSETEQRQIIDSAVDSLTEVFQKAAIAAVIKTRVKKKSRSNTNVCPKKKTKAWFNDECALAKKQLTELGRKLNKPRTGNMFNRSLQADYKAAKKKYKSLLNHSKKIYQAHLYNQLDSLNSKNPRAFWELYKKVNSLEDQPSVNPIDTATWVDHFKGLLNSPLSVDPALESEIADYLMNPPKLFNELNVPITIMELVSHITKLKGGKAACIDALINEMLKCASPCALNKILEIFNRILATGIYPSSWRMNFLTPLHKKGDQNLPTNYRGIAVGSCLAKLLLSILKTRLDKFITDHNLVPNEQIGFQAGSRTSDHIFTLATLIIKYTLKNGGKLYTCFVDFKSAFDTVWRDALFFKLYKMNIGGNFMSLIRDMYSNVMYSIKIDGGITKPFTSSIGVKQGGVLSPQFFKLFLADLPSIFDNTCDPVSLNKKILHCLMYADDLILLSKSKEGLQNCINKLSDYCKRWNLTVNTSKTQVVIFNKTGHIF